VPSAKVGKSDRATSDPAGGLLVEGQKSAQPTADRCVTLFQFRGASADSGVLLLNVRSPAVVDTAPRLPAEVDAAFMKSQVQTCCYKSGHAVRPQRVKLTKTRCDEWLDK